MAKIGYARVSSISQNLESQIKSLKDAGCVKIFEGKYSGTSKKNADQITALIDYIRDDDVVVVTRLDRLGRSLKMILQTIEQIHQKQASLKTLDGALDTSNENAISKAMVSLIGVFAQLERDLIFDRTSEGREIARNKGKHMGRPKTISDEKRKQIRTELKSNSVNALAKKYDVSRTTIQRIRAEDK